MSVQQTGSVSPGHLVSWTASGVVQDAGSSASPYVNSLGLYGRGGKPLSITNTPVPGNPSGVWSQLNAGVSTSAAYINVDTFGTTAIPLNLSVNGTTVLSVTQSGPAFAAPVPVSSGGTGLTATPANGQLLIGNGSGYTLAPLTGGTGITISNSAGSITIVATGTAAAVIVIGSSPVTGGVVGDVLVVGAGNVTSQVSTTGTGSAVFSNGPTLHGTISFTP